jgi:hypothetical protein
MTLAAAGFVLLQIVLARQDPNDTARKLEFERINQKAIASASTYALSIPLAFVSVYASFAIFVIIPLIYFWPDRKSTSIE